LGAPISSAARANDPRRGWAVGAIRWR
jgi:hypothetical protein